MSSPKNKKHCVYIVPFSHLDLFWAGTREECLSRGNFIIRKALELLEENPEFRFLLETTNFVEHYLSCFPEDLERLKRLAAEGRLEFIPMRSGIYSQLPSGESTVRNLLYGMEFCDKVLGIQPNIMSTNDIPGYIPQLPQIAALAGMEKLIISRWYSPENPCIKWLALDGTAMTTYCPCCHYDFLVTRFPKNGLEFEEMLSDGGESELEEQTSKHDYPLMLNWGTDIYASSSKVLENIRTWNESGRREFRFSTYKEFLDKSVPETLKELSGEIPSLWPNIESSWPDLWAYDIPCEEALFKAEFFGALNTLNGYDDYPKDELHEAWMMLLDAMDHNQNGQGGEVADKDKMQQKMTAKYIAEQQTQKLSWRLAARATAPHEGAFGIAIFNTLPWKRSNLVTGRTSMYGETMRRFLEIGESYRLLDPDGQEVPFRTVNHYMHGADSVELEFMAKDVPANGCKVYYLVRGEPKTFAPSSTIIDDEAEDRNNNPRRYAGSNVYENKFFRMEINRITGNVNIFDKVNEREMFSGLAIVGVEERRGDYIERMELTGRVFPSLIDGIELLENNAVCTRVQIKGSICDQPFRQIITIYADTADMEIENHIDWQEIRYVRLQQLFPFSTENQAEIRYGTAFGQVKYPESIYSTLEGDAPEPFNRIRLSRHWTDIGDEKSGVTIGSDHRMWEFEDNLLRSYMIRGIGWCSGVVKCLEGGKFEAVARPPAGKYVFRYLIRPRNGKSIPQGRCGWELNSPLHCVSVTDPRPSDNPGLELPALPDCTNSSVIVSSIKAAEDDRDSIILRCFESMGQTGILKLPNVPGRGWFESDLKEKKLVETKENELEFRPFEIKTLKLKKV